MVLGPGGGETEGVREAVSPTPRPGAIIIRDDWLNRSQTRQGLKIIERGKKSKKMLCGPDHEGRELRPLYITMKMRTPGGRRLDTSTPGGCVPTSLLRHTHVGATPVPLPCTASQAGPRVTTNLLTLEVADGEVVQHKEASFPALALK